MQIKQYIDSTYLKTQEESGLTFDAHHEAVLSVAREAIAEGFKLVMIRPDKVQAVKKILQENNTNLLIGTVVSFPEGIHSISEKLEEAEFAIQAGADELDFVANYTAFKNGELELVKEEIFKGTQLALTNNKVVKWIIEVAALSDAQIIQFSALIKNVVLSNFKEEQYANVFVKSSTGFYKTENNLPNGATFPAIVMMLENSFPLSVKAAGGVRTYEEAVRMIKMGVKRIGTSSAKSIASGANSNSDY